jgi:anti-anti-sigma factor
MMLIKAKSFADTTVLQCAGSLLAGDEIIALKRAALESCAESILILDLSRVDRIDGAGLGLLAFLQCWSRSAGIRLRIADPSPRVRRLLDLTRLTSVLEICNGDEAMYQTEDTPNRIAGCLENAFMALPMQS